MDKEYLAKKLPLFKVYTFESIESTNTFAKSLNDEFALVIADMQTNGKGRMGRQFYSPPGTGLYFSFKMKVNEMYKNVPFISTAASVAVQKGILSSTGIKAGIKWVNDIYLNGKKLSGILCENADNESAVIGVGINLLNNNLPDVAASLFKEYIPVRKEDIIIAVAQNLTNILTALPDTSFIDYYRENSIVLGNDILCIQQDTVFKAHALDIDECGGLVVETDDGIRTLSTGEISIRFTDQSISKSNGSNIDVSNVL